ACATCATRWWRSARASARRTEGNFELMVDEDVVAWRRHLHRHPEISFQEHETSGWIAERLEEFGLSVERPTETSVLARLGSGGPTVALRADIDALPIDERSGVPFASERP